MIKSSSTEELQSTKCNGCGLRHFQLAKFCSECGKPLPPLDMRVPPSLPFLAETEVKAPPLIASTSDEAGGNGHFLSLLWVRKVGLFVVTVSAVILASFLWLKTHPITAEAQYSLGWRYLNGENFKRDESEAFHWIHRAADHRYPDAEAQLGFMYVNGIGINKDYAQAANWYRRAAQDGSPLALYNLGAMYNEGLGFQKDMPEAIRWWRKAAEQGYAEAQNNIGAAYKLGQGGLPKDNKQAMFWFSKSAAQGNADAEQSLASSYFTGDGEEKNEAQGIELWRKAAVQGDASSEYNLGVGYEKGLGGLTADPEQALDWYSKAAEQGNQDAKKAIVNIRTNQQQRQAELLAQQQQEQEVSTRKRGESIDFASLYAKAYGTGLRIGKRYNITARVTADLGLYSTNASSGDAIYGDHAFDDDEQMETVIGRAVNENHLICTVVVSMGNNNRIQIHRAENCH